MEDSEPVYLSIRRFLQPHPSGGKTCGKTYICRPTLPRVPRASPPNQKRHNLKSGIALRSIPMGQSTLVPELARYLL